MALLTVHFFGQSILKQNALHVILPPGRGPFPVMYLLHGLSDDYTIWLRRTDIERYAENWNLMIVMPDGGRSFYCNDPRPEGMAYENHIVKDVVGFIDTAFRTIARREARAIAGLSMGGYGAFMLAMRHPQLFSVACSHSGALNFGYQAFPFHASIQVSPDIKALADNLPRDGRYDLFQLARQLTKSRLKLALRVDCGKADGLLKANRVFHAHLKQIRLKHEYREYAGGHNWDYWDAHIRESIAFIVNNLGIRK